jgi:hypothetical protein
MTSRLMCFAVPSTTRMSCGTEIATPTIDKLRCNADTERKPRSPIIARARKTSLRGAVDDDDLLDALEALRDEEAFDSRAVEEVLRGMLSILTSSHIKKEIAV